jgi:hypothetical protein
VCQIQRSATVPRWFRLISHVRGDRGEIKFIKEGKREKKREKGEIRESLDTIDALSLSSHVDTAVVS